MSGITEQSSAAHSTEPVDKGKGKAIVPVEETEGETSDEEMVYPPALLYYTIPYLTSSLRRVEQLITWDGY